MAARYEGGCLCGAIRYAALGEPVNQRVCHCRVCQKALGATFNGRLLFAVSQVTLSGPVATYPSSAAVERGFCARCGTTLFSRRAAAGTIGLTAGSLDDPRWFRPTMHIWTSSRQAWLRPDGELPCWPAAAPAL